MPENWETVPRPASIVENRLLSRGTYWMGVQLEDDLPFPFKAGNVVSLHLQVAGKRYRHPYSVCAADEESRELGFLFRVVQGGTMSPVLAQFGAGNPIAVSGCFGTPVQQLVHPNATSLVGVSTGSGIGPLAGFAREALVDPAWTRPIVLLTGFRSEVDVPLVDQLCAMEEDERFRWFPSLSKPETDWDGLTGRVSQTLPELFEVLAGAHVHLVGNGKMISEMRMGLLKAGHPGEFITSEAYFGKHEGPAEAVIEELALQMKGRVG